VNHHLRLVEVANANPLKSPRNKVLCYVDNAKEFIDEVPKGSKSNACRLVDVLFAASKFENKQQQIDWETATFEFAKKEFGEANIVLAVVHNDETTPHIHVIFKPVNPKTLKLGAGHWFDGVKKMQGYQDKYAESVKAFGFERGEKGSRANHKTISQFYRDIHAAQDEYNNFKKSLSTLHTEIKKVNFLDRFKPDFLSTLVLKHLQKVSSSAKKLLLIKQILEVEKVSEKNQELLEKINTLQDKLELATGLQDPNYVQLEAFAAEFERFQEFEKSNTPALPTGQIPEAVNSEKSNLATTTRPRF
jgi:hypothetical protein